jgi:hypothetical protein
MPRPRSGTLFVATMASPSQLLFEAIDQAESEQDLRVDIVDCALSEVWIGRIKAMS